MSVGNFMCARNTKKIEEKGRGKEEEKKTFLKT